MRTSCYSGHRCNRRGCPTCRWRYAGRIARRILDRASGHFCAVEIDPELHTLADFWCWRVEARNLIDRRRRASRWWRDLGLSVWLSMDGRVRGIVSLGAVSAEEFEAAVGRRWPVKLRGIDPAKLREEIYSVIRPGLIADTVPERGRYQPIKFHIGPTRCAVRKTPKAVMNIRNRWIEPMPVVI